MNHTDIIRPPIYEIKQPIFIIGDHHGFTGEMFEAIEKQNVQDAVIVHVGDGEEGISFGPRQFEELNSWFAKRKILFLGIRGNHCDPNIFDGRVDLSHFKLVPDYTQLVTPSERWLLIGGAISIDRYERIPGFNWWPKETFSLRPELSDSCDVLVTHSGPSWIGPQKGKGMVRLFADTAESYGDDLIAELNAERIQHEELFRLVQPSRWYLGHFHRSEQVIHDGCTTRVLDICELIKHQP